MNRLLRLRFLSALTFFPPKADFLVVHSEVILLPKNAVIWDMAPCRYCVKRRFGGTYRLRLQGRKIRERGTNVSRWLQALKMEPKRRFTQDLHGATSQKTAFFIVTAVKTSNLTLLPFNIYGKGKIIRGLPGVRRPGREADHSSPSNAEVKNGGAIPPPPYAFMA
jgi:hypothetical protein